MGARMARSASPAIPEGAMPDAPPRAGAASSGELLGRLRAALPAPARCAQADAPLPAVSREAEILPNSWLDDLVRQYRPAAQRLRRRRRLYRRASLLAMAVAALASAVFWRDLRASYLAAYPAEPTKREALRACSLENPSFIRFLADERAACYERLSSRLLGAEAAATDDLPR